MNNLRTVLLLGTLTGLFLLIGGLLAGQSGMLWALAAAAVLNFSAYWFSSAIVLRTYRAQPITETENPNLHRLVREIAQRGDIPLPRLYLIDEESPNAFATGRNPQHAVLALTSGILHTLSAEELQGVIAHELAHIRHRDTLIATLAATLAGAILVLARWAFFFGGANDDNRRGAGASSLFMLILAPLAAMLIQLAISRSREYKADDGSARLTGNPESLASALEKLDSNSRRLPLTATGPTAHLFIVSPLRAGGRLALFSTHPPIAERVRRLRSWQAGN